MRLDTHAFKEAFIAAKIEGYALRTEPQKKESTVMSFLTQKFDDQHLCMFVFESKSDAEKEMKIAPASIEVLIEKVAISQVQSFAKIGHFGIPALVFLRDLNGDFASL